MLKKLQAIKNQNNLYNKDYKIFGGNVNEYISECKMTLKLSTCKQLKVISI